MAPDAGALRWIPFHDLLHIFATLKIVSEMTAHAGPDHTQDLYRALLGGMQRTAAEALDAVLVNGHTEPLRPQVGF